MHPTGYSMLKVLVQAGIPVVSLDHNPARIGFPSVWRQDDLSRVGKGTRNCGFRCAGSYGLRRETGALCCKRRLHALRSQTPGGGCASRPRTMVPAEFRVLHRSDPCEDSIGREKHRLPSQGHGTQGGRSISVSDNEGSVPELRYGDDALSNSRGDLGHLLKNISTEVA